MADYISPSVVSPSSYVVNQYTLQQVAEQAYRMAGVLKMPGQHISFPSEAQECLDITNHMVDGWKIENLLIIFYIRTVVQAVAFQKEYGVGPSQDWDIERPEKIHTAGFLLQPDQTTESEMPMGVILTYDDYAGFIAKNTKSDIPLILYYGATLPYGTATLWPVPNIDSKVALYTQGALQEFSGLDDMLITPKGYREMLMYNLAVRVHQRYPQYRMDPSVERYAIFYKERVKNQQLTPMYAKCDPAVVGRGGVWVGGMPKIWSPYY